MGNYENNAQIIKIVCTEKEIKEYICKPNDENNVINVIIQRVATTLQSNSTLPFSYHESTDIFQLCWMWCVEILKAHPPKYNFRTPLFGYLYRACINEILQLKRNQQWRTDIALQKECKKCEHRNDCTRRVKYEDLASTPKCKVMAAALARNQAKFALSVSMEMEYDMSTQIDKINHLEVVEINDLVEFFITQIPEKYKSIFNKMIKNRSLADIPKHDILATRRWCWKALNKIDKEQAEYYRRIYSKLYQKD